MNDLRTLLDQLEDKRLDYVQARSHTNSDAAAFREAGISKATFYDWPEEERKTLNDLAQRVKREVVTRVLMRLQDAAEEAVQVKIGGLKSRNEHVKQDAATEIIDRVLGKPANRTELTGAGGGAVEMTLKVVKGVSVDDL